MKPFGTNLNSGASGPKHITQLLASLLLGTTANAQSFQQVVFGQLTTVSLSAATPSSGLVITLPPGGSAGLTYTDVSQPVSAFLC